MKTRFCVAWGDICVWVRVMTGEVAPREKFCFVLFFKMPAENFAERFPNKSK